VSVTALVGVGVFILLGFGEGEVSDPTALAFFGAGAVAVCAMILPGISGSLILLMLGMYSPVLAAVTDRDYGTVVIFTIGAVVGLALFSQLLHWALQRHHDLMLAGLIGLMAGSTRILWPWPGGVESPELGRPGEDWIAVAAAGLIGSVAVWLISRLAVASEAGVSRPPPASVLPD
jgi:putative membrane protein